MLSELDEFAPRAVYPTPEGTAQFVQRCPKCGRYVTADKIAEFRGEHMRPVDPNATCSKCGRVGMCFEGWV